MDSEAVSTFLPVRRRSKAKVQVQGDARRLGQGALIDGGVAPITTSHCNLEPLPRELAPASGGRVVSAVANSRARQRAAQAVEEERKDAAFQTWWRENRASRVSQAPAAGATGQDRLAAVRSRLLARIGQ